MDKKYIPYLLFALVLAVGVAYYFQPANKVFETSFLTLSGSFLGLFVKSPVE